MRRLFVSFPLKHPLIVSAVLGAALTLPTYAIAKAKAKTKEKNAPVRPTRAEEKQDVTVIQAEQMTGRPDREVFLERDVEVERGQTKIRSDMATFYQEENVVEADGHIHLTRFGDQYWGDRIRYNLDTGEGWLLKPRYKLLQNNAQGKGNRADFESNELSTVDQGTYTTCNGDDPDWYVSASTLYLNQPEDTGEASGAILFFKDVPLLGAPYLSFPLSEGRKSGFLPPTFGTSTSGGFETMLPYYFNIAPNRDFTFYPKYISKRGNQLGGDARYLEQNFSGQLRFEFLQEDRETQDDRYAFSFIHRQQLMRNLWLGWNLNHVSDDAYFSDFTSHFSGMANALTGLSNASVAPSAQRLLSREVSMDYLGENWATNLRVTNYQLLQDETAAEADKIVRPYQRLPQLSYRVWHPTVSGLDWGFRAEWTRFWLSDGDLQMHRAIVNASQKGEFGDKGDRWVLKPQLSYSLIEPGYFIKPKVSWQAVRYEVENEWDGSRSMSMTVPTYSLDAGLIFERETSFFSRQYTQTLEPRLFYVKTPYRDQREHPNFDSAEPGLTFAQLFSENRFSGSDRIGDADQLTAAIVSRYIEPSGVERARFAIGQRFYYQNQEVYLESPSNDSRSDVLLTANASVIPAVTLDGAVQYSENEGRMLSSNATLQWKPAFKKVFNVSYRYLRDKPGEYVGLDQLNMSAQWPIYKRWYGVGMVSYSLPESQVIQGMAGLEYSADCWTFRMVAQRLYTATNVVDNAYFVQLEFKGFSKIGTGALEALRKSISGYDFQESPRK
ncbi:MAG: LPS-assembly protein LptD [Oxalobacter sp.]|nr:MAG: LPS-assembly protein LptD [Oxalobacter sp.]